MFCLLFSCAFISFSTVFSFHLFLRMNTNNGLFCYTLWPNVLFAYVCISGRNRSQITIFAVRIHNRSEWLNKQQNSRDRETSNFVSVAQTHIYSFCVRCVWYSHKHVPIWMMLFRELSDQWNRCWGNNIAEAFACDYNMARSSRKLIVNCSASNAMYRISIVSLCRLSRLPNNITISFNTEPITRENASAQQQQREKFLWIRFMLAYARDIHDLDNYCDCRSVEYFCLIDMHLSRSLSLCHSLTWVKSKALANSHITTVISKIILLLYFTIITECY